MKASYEKNCEYYTKALVLAVTAPTKEKCEECSQIAASIGENLSDKDKQKYKIAAELAIEIYLTKNFLSKPN